MRNLLWILTLALVLVMPTQWGFYLGGTRRPIVRSVAEPQPDGTTRMVERTDIKREGGVNVTPGDALLVALFLLWAAHVLLRFKVFEVRLPPLAVFVLLAVALASALHSQNVRAGLKEFVQLGAYFFGGWLVFANCIDTRPRLKAAVGLFTLVVAVIVVLALFQYRAAVTGNVFAVAGSFGNRNVLGAFFAVALPFLFAIGLYERRLWQRFALILTVAIGALVTLSGGALIALAVALFFVAALKSRTALLGVAVAVVLALTVVPATFRLPRQSDVIVSSVAPYVNNNWLDRRAGDPKPHDYLVVATRYKRWHAALNLIRRHLELPFLGVGPGRFNETIEPEYGSVEKPSGYTDTVRDFNINTTEPDSFNMYFVTCAEMGPFALVALIWLGTWLLGRNVVEGARCADEYGRALALGAAGAVVGAALVAVFSSILVRGVAMPFIFVALSGILWPRLPDRYVPERLGRP